ncbi:hypothetical protein L6164_019976 [Bauhinia variegata]|uniref:Uncharacterized protein n=1 Tax=Bauhinia variegata TaxID=167791 RepID=A0ACB9MV66_BAUVA|nr:hypothetical protein L6164_019976 [Bauhinia variegata]
MGRVMEYLATKTDPATATATLIDSDLKELKNLINDATKLGGLGFGTSFLKWVSSLSAIYLLILDRTNWRTNMLTSLLVPYVFFSFPGSLFHFLRGEFGRWIAFVAVVLRLFFPRHFPGTYQGNGWIQKFFHTEAWNIKYSWPYPHSSLSCLVHGTPFSVEHSHLFPNSSLSS